MASPSTARYRRKVKDRDERFLHTYDAAPAHYRGGFCRAIKRDDHTKDWADAQQLSATMPSSSAGFGVIEASRLRIIVAHLNLKFGNAPSCGGGTIEALSPLRRALRGRCIEHDLPAAHGVDHAAVWQPTTGTMAPALARPGLLLRLPCPPFPSCLRSHPVPRFYQFQNMVRTCRFPMPAST